MRQFAVIGLGRFGSSVARSLARMGNEVLAVDIDEGQVQAISGTVTHAVQCDATSEEALKGLGIRNVDAVVVAIGHDIQASILTTLVLKGLGVRFVVAKAQSELHGKVLEKVGADRVVYPERDMGARVAHNIASSNILDYIELSPDFSLIESVAPRELHGKTLRELNLRARHGVNVLAIKRGVNVNMSPGADDSILEGDVLVLSGRNETLERFERK